MKLGVIKSDIVSDGRAGMSCKKNKIRLQIHYMNYWMSKKLKLFNFAANAYPQIHY